jgi:hypothetical protein
MKISKFELKSIVKECLVELLSEGLGGGAAHLPSRVSEGNNKLTSQAKQQSKMPTSALSNAIKAEAGGNKVMESILADTATSTLPRMLENDRKGAPIAHPGGVAEQVVAAVDPSQLFGEDTTSRWANLAFMDSPTKK